MNAEIGRPFATVLYGPLGATMIAVEEALVCPQCRKAYFRFVNRDGRTVCCACDLPRQREAERREEKQPMVPSAALGAGFGRRSTAEKGSAA